MKILLFGEYSNVHWTLAEGLRTLGHEVTVVSNGDFWKDYPRDIDLTRKPTRLGGLAYIARLLRIMPSLRGYDIVQIINPMFVELKARWIKPIYNYLRRNNKCMVMCAFGMDYYWVSTCCDAIVAGLYEYWRCYEPHFPDKTQFIPFPIKCSKAPIRSGRTDSRIRLFIGINRKRSEYKGTDIMLRAAQDIEKKYNDRVQLIVAESVPFSTYCEMMEGSDAILDQLYSYTPAMNSLQAMSRGIINIGGGEEENYEIIGETTLRPIIDVRPTYDSVYEALERLVTHPEDIATLRQQSMEYIKKHHDYIKVAKSYEALYAKLLQR